MKCEILLICNIFKDILKRPTKKIVHRSNWHAQNRPKTMVEINKLAFEFMEG